MLDFHWLSLEQKYNEPLNMTLLKRRVCLVFHFFIFCKGEPFSHKRSIKCELTKTLWSLVIPARRIYEGTEFHAVHKDLEIYS